MCLAVLPSAPLKKTFRVRLREWREAKDLKQKEAADLFGVTLNGYQKWEYGTCTPSKLAMVEIERRMTL